RIAHGRRICPRCTEPGPRMYRLALYTENVPARRPYRHCEDLHRRTPQLRPRRCSRWRRARRIRQSSAQRGCETWRAGPFQYQWRRVHCRPNSHSDRTEAADIEAAVIKTDIVAVSLCGDIGQGLQSTRDTRQAMTSDLGYKISAAILYPDDYPEHQVLA